MDNVHCKFCGKLTVAVQVMSEPAPRHLCINEVCLGIGWLASQTIKFPPRDVDQASSGSGDAAMGGKVPLADEMAKMLSDLYAAAGTHIGAPIPMLHLAMKKGERDLVAIGICIAADAMRQAMSDHQAGSAALDDLVHKPRLHDVQGK